jgi:cytochrome c6
MPTNKTRHSVIYTSAILTSLAVLTTLFPASRIRADNGQGRAASATTFRTKCATCHGENGAGSEVGKSMNVPDLRSPEVQKLPDAELAQIIADGKGGMPPFKNSLSAQQINALVKYIRSLRQRK